MTPTQAATGRCLDCGGETRITPTLSAWEFNTTCSCGQRTTISWAHHHPPPRYVPAVVKARETLPLFSE